MTSSIKLWDMKVKLSHIEKIRRDNAALKAEVQNLLGWDDYKYASFQMDMGMEYLRQAFGDATLVDAIPSHKAFWSWWRMHWVKRDREFLEVSGLLFKGEMEEYYRDLHQPGSIVFFPHSGILEATYSEMMHGLIKEAVR